MLSIFLYMSFLKGGDKPVYVTLPKGHTNDLDLFSGKAVILLISADGKAFIHFKPGDDTLVVKEMGHRYGYSIKDKQLQYLRADGYFGTDINSFARLDQLPDAERRNVTAQGLSLQKDSVQITDWIRVMRASNKRAFFCIEADEKLPYTKFQILLSALRKNGINRFVIITA